MSRPILEIYFENGKFGVRSSLNYSQPVELTEHEAKALSIINDILDGYGDIRVERHSDNYLSIVTGERGDFCRLKMTERTKWMSLDLWKSPAYIQNDERLKSVKNKNQRHWKIILTDINDIRNYADFIVSAFEFDKNM